MTSPLTLTCTSCGGWPLPKLTWYQHGEVATQGNLTLDQNDTCSIATLHFESVEPVYDHDLFECLADNGFLGNKSAAVEVMLETGSKYKLLSVFLAHVPEQYRQS